jgi:hypothetical protein
MHPLVTHPSPHARQPRPGMTPASSYVTALQQLVLCSYVTLILVGVDLQCRGHVASISPNQRSAKPAAGAGTSPALTAGRGPCGFFTAFAAGAIPLVARLSLSAPPF